MAEKRLVLVTGANSGIGFELCNQLLSKGNYHVLLGSRSVDKGKAAVHDLESRQLPGSVELIEIDMTKDDTIYAAAEKVETTHGRLDVLVNNAAIGGLGASRQFGDQSDMRQRMRDSFDTNATGPAITGMAFGPLLQKSTSNPRIINVSSGAGSISRRLDASSPYYKQGEVQYRASKAALSMVAACQVADYADHGIKVFLYCPGFTVSNLSPMNKVANGAKETKDGVEPLVDILEGKRDDEAGRFLNIGGTYEW